MTKNALTLVGLSGLTLMAALSPASAQIPGPFAPPSPPGPTFAMNQGMDIQTREDDKGYYLIIRTQGIAPDQVRVDIQGNQIAIEAGNENSRRVTRNGPGNDGRGQSYSYHYSYSSSSSHTFRRLSLPLDADTGKLAREDGEGQVTIFIPRKVDNSRTSR